MAGAAGVLLACRAAAAEIIETPGTIDPSGALFVQPGAVQTTVQPTVGVSEPIQPLQFRAGQTQLRETADGKGEPPSERHWKFILGFTFGAEYDDNIFLLPSSSKQGDFVFGFSPTLGFQLGDTALGRNYLTFVYTPTFVVFADHSDQNSVEHLVNLSFVRQAEIWKIAGNFNFQSLNGASSPLRNAGGNPQSGEQIGERVDRQLYALGLRYNYRVSDKTSFEIGLAGDYTHYQSFLSTIDMVSQNYIDYAVTGKTSLGLGFGIGYSKSEGSPSETYEQALLRVKYIATSKLTFEAHGGPEFRRTSGGGSQVTGVFGLGVSYAAAEHTTIGLSAYRSVNPSSALQSTDYTVTGITLSASRVIREKLTVTLATGYENSQYRGITSGVDFSRNDNYYFIRPSLQYQTNRLGVIELFYEYRVNDSSFDQFQFANNRVGVKFGYTF